MSDFEQTVKNAQTELAELVEKMNALKKEYGEKMQSGIKEACKSFFETNPKIAAITWVQYTPYFNDGDPCEFRVGDIWAISQNGYTQWVEDGQGYAEEYSVYIPSWREPTDEDAKKLLEKDGLTLEEAKKIKEFTNTLSKIPDDIMLSMFDDHAEVTITRDGITVEAYSHD